MFHIETFAIERREETHILGRAGRTNARLGITLRPSVAREEPLSYYQGIGKGEMELFMITQLVS